jgi:hypothetical protein
MKNARGKKSITTGYFQMLPAILAAVITLVLGFAAPKIWAGDYHHHRKPGLENFEETHIFFELNNTDGDLGIHGKVDGGPWKKIWLQDSTGRKLMKVTARGRLRRQGVTELFFESAEPTFDDLPPADFFDRFPEGIYKAFGISEDGNLLVGRSRVTHVMPAPPEPTVNDKPMADQCDDEEPGYDATEVTTPVTIAWSPVTMSHPAADGGGAGVQPPVPVEIVNYEVVVEVETEDGFEAVFSIILPPDVTEITIPEELTDLGDTFKYEILAREESFNQTATESCFLLEAEDGDDDDDE